MTPRRPRLTYPFTILTASDTVRLVAGEDFRYTLSSPQLDTWLPAWLAILDGKTTLDDALAKLPESRRAAALQLAQQLYGERVLIDGSALEAHSPMQYRVCPEGNAGWLDVRSPWSVVRSKAENDELLRTEGQALRTKNLPVLCQDSLNYEEALQFNRRCRAEKTAWLWASTGPMSRAYVGPLFLPDAGPCLLCLFNHFRRLSPAPELYDSLADHVRNGGDVNPVPFPAAGIAIVQQLVIWKASLAAEREPPAALYRLHVVEATTLEVTSHRVFIDPDCPEHDFVLRPQ